jgi:hypothetical protein
MHTARHGLTLLLFLLTVALAGCAPPSEPPPVAPTRASVDAATFAPITGQRLYVPAYSQIFYADDQRTWDFAVTLAIHNTDEVHAIAVESIRYHNGEGELVREYVTAPFVLPPLATHSVTVARSDNEGGVGANFIVDWAADADVPEPVVQAVMISAAGQQGLSLITDAVVIAERSAP